MQAQPIKFYFTVYSLFQFLLVKCTGMSRPYKYVNGLNPISFLSDLNMALYDLIFLPFEVFRFIM